MKRIVHYSKERELIIFFMLLVLGFGLFGKIENYHYYLFALGGFGILFPKIVQPFFFLMDRVFPPFQSFVNSIVLSLLFILFVLPVGLIRNIFNRHEEPDNKEAKVFSAQDMEQPF